MKKLTKQDIIDILYGCTIVGTGGGGDLQLGLDLMQEDFDEGRELYMVDPAEVPDEAYVGVPYMCGSPASLNKTARTQLMRFMRHASWEFLL